jgi:hypothetical protein
VNLHDPRLWAVFLARHVAGIRDGVDIGYRAGSGRSHRAVRVAATARACTSDHSAKSD